MKKRVLMVATVPSMIGRFNMNNIQLLLNLGYQVDVAANFNDTSVWPVERIKKFMEQMRVKGIDCIQINFSRNPLKFSKHYKSYKEIVGLIQKKKYIFIHTHTPIASAIVRQAAHKTKTKVIYTAHGFHFYDGAPFKNWLIFYPIEKWYSRYTDVLVTINKEDFKRASENFHAKKTVYIPGVGIDTEKFAPRRTGREKLRSELGIKDSQFMLLSVGELNENKNHGTVIRAIRDLQNITYVIVGKGELESRLKQVAIDNNVDVRLVGFREDVASFYNAADAYILPSIREGLNVSLMEAMASGLPCLCGNIRGNVDLIDDQGGYLFKPESVNEISELVRKIAELSLEERRTLGIYNLEKIRSYNLKTVEKLSYEIYRD